MTLVLRCPVCGFGDIDIEKVERECPKCGAILQEMEE